MTYLESKPRYEILDGLRGVAALMVVAFHLFETYSPGPTEQIINHGYLAVDFFFMLSGFVIGYAYDDRWGKMNIWDFFKRRIVRLQPMVAMGTILGTLWFFAGDYSPFSLMFQAPIWKILVVTVLGCLLIPVGPWWDVRGWAETYPMNNVCWSLMWEYLGNIMYALFVRRFSNTVLAIFVALSALLTIDVAMRLDTFALLGQMDYAAFTLIGGWSLTPDHLYIGITRLLYPFFMGLLLCRIGKRIRVRGGFWWCSLMIAAILACPCIGGKEFGWANGLYCVVIVLAVFPIVVMMGAGSVTTDSRTTAWCKWLGEISYPLYITHYPYVYFQMAWAERNADAPLSVAVFMSVSLFILAIGTAWACLKLYDEPVRLWLKDHWLKRTTHS